MRGVGVASVLWLEDAIAHYDVPTCVFDLFLLVADPDHAARQLRRAGWLDVESDPRRCPFLVEPCTVQHLCLEPPALEEPAVPSLGPMSSPPPPPPKDPPRVTRTVLLSARDCNVSMQTLVSSELPDSSYVPSLPFLVDGLISGVLDAAPESQLESRMAMQLVYLYAHCHSMRSSALAGQLKTENRQFHIDALTGPSVGKAPLLAWNRRVRRELRDGARHLMYENSLLSAKPTEYQRFIFHVRSEFCTLPHEILQALTTPRS